GDRTVGGRGIVRWRYLAAARRAVRAAEPPAAVAKTSPTVSTATPGPGRGGPERVATAACLGQRERRARRVRDGVSGDGLARAKPVRGGRGRGRPGALRLVAP